MPRGTFDAVRLSEGAASAGPAGARSEPKASEVHEDVLVSSYR
jgi:hypothetical protein